MDADEALTLADRAVFEKTKEHLNDVQREVFLGSWEGLTYGRIARNTNRSEKYLSRDIGPKLWLQLSEALEEDVGKANLRGPIERYQARSLLQSPHAPEPVTAPPIESLLERSSPPSIKWVDPPDVRLFCCRSRDLDNLTDWIAKDYCRLVMLYGMTGIGKTWLSVKLSQQLQVNDETFEFLYWRSLQSAPSLSELLHDLIGFLSQQTELELSLTQLRHYLTQHRCLIVFDQLETLLQPGVYDGSYRRGYEDYSELLRLIGESDHQSCVVLVSSHQFRQVERLGSDSPLVRSWQLPRLRERDWEAVCHARAKVVGRAMPYGTDQQWRSLVRCYDGNPRWLSEATDTILSTFDGSVSSFLEQLGPNETALLDAVQLQLNQHFSYLSDLEITIIHCLTTIQEPATLMEILQSVVRLVPQLNQFRLGDVMQSLRRRSLIEGNLSFCYRESLGLVVRAYLANQGSAVND
ncbi:MAG: ATP-binding protein [Stenomitos rutilans HA7619-LM2]|jgi:virulence-associated protein VapD|nr:ATP-binding protein [Stenomitos rutilans HA7619-LM2]